MGNCFRKFLRVFTKRQTLRKYTALDSNVSRADEVSGLVFDDEDGLLGGSSSRGQPTVTPITENEKLLLKSKNYAAIIQSQKAWDEEIDKQLALQEEKLRHEEEELLKAKRLRNQQILTSQSAQNSADVIVGKHCSIDKTGDKDFDDFLTSIGSRYRSTPGDEEGEEINEEDFVVAEPS